MEDENQKLAYSIGVNIAENLRLQGVNNLDIEAFTKALEDVYQNDSLLVTEEEANAFIQDYFQNLAQRQAISNLQEGQAFLDSVAAVEGIVKLQSGLLYEVIEMGDGPKPGINDQVKTHYHGTLINGDVFDSSVERGEPVTFPLNGVIAGWTEALQLMPVGSKWRLFIPPTLGYGERGTGGAIGPNETLVFEVELIEIK
ncbi:MAG: FKBP-type peptidyl-prolyl cis-trans isomerase [Chitinophagaceae bacterium]|nr:MAG: FKBP-type peptidyl-prolyl cis-trans isomerase [Chitinophagaceae bacterium]